MALMINTNVASLNAQNSLLKSGNALSKTFERLSTGMRINRASDDAAGLSISQKMTAQIRGTNQAVRNSNDAISLVQVAEGALDETHNALQRMRELAVQAASDTMTSSDRADAWDEMTQLACEIDRIATQTEFNGKVLLGGTTAVSLELKFHIGAETGQTLDVAIGVAGNSAIGITSALETTTDVAAMSAVPAQSLANSVIAMMDLAIASVSDIRSELGAVQNRLDSIVSNLSNVSENTSAARSRIMDADVAAETSSLTKNAILQQAGAAILAQANQQPQLALQLLG